MRPRSALAVLLLYVSRLAAVASHPARDRIRTTGRLSLQQIAADYRETPPGAAASVKIADAELKSDAVASAIARCLKVPRAVLMPVIMLFCVVGAFAINNTPFDVTVMLVAGIAAYFLEASGFPVAPAILGVVLGGMLEENFITSMIKADGNFWAFVQRPVAATLCALTLAVWFLPLLLRRLRRLAGV